MVSLLAAIGASSGLDMLTDLAWIMCVAAATTVLFQRLHQPVVLGYLLAGLIVGPHLPIPRVRRPGAGPPAVRAGRDPADVLPGPGVQPAQAGAGRPHRRPGGLHPVQPDDLAGLRGRPGVRLVGAGEPVHRGRRGHLQHHDHRQGVRGAERTRGRQAGSATEGDRLRRAHRAGPDRRPAAGDPDAGGLGGRPVGGRAGADGRQAGGVPDRDDGGGCAGRARGWCG